MGIKSVIGYTATGVVALVIGMAVSNPPTAAAPPTVVVPSSCSQALNQADKGFSLAAKSLQAQVDGDLPKAIYLNVQLDATATAYNDLKAQCRASS